MRNQNDIGPERGPNAKPEGWVRVKESEMITDNEIYEASYIDAMLFSETDENGEPLDSVCDRDSLSPDARECVARDVAAFLEKAAPWLKPEHYTGKLPVKSFNRFPEHFTVGEMALHDFWLTRNGHGAGFWDGDWSDEAGKALTALSQEFGECYAFVGENGEIDLL